VVLLALAFPLLIGAFLLAMQALEVALLPARLPAVPGDAPDDDPADDVPAAEDAADGGPATVPGIPLVVRPREPLTAAPAPVVGRPDGSGGAVIPSPR
jgi:hypothetical protein